MMEDLTHIKEIFFLCTTMIFIMLYITNLVYSIFNLFKGIKILNSFWYNIVILSCITTLFTLIACFDWLVNEQFMHLDVRTNLIWFLHHGLTAYSFFNINKKFYDNIQYSDREFDEDIRKCLEKIYVRD